ncbi:hypothetical protein [Fibrobacter succinogenes]|jgi:hypothetical protein|uniref:hypothetical protein n=1 Tax=Fibrobacter succinogenes TaxID=833 RepID=UPI0015690F88|nr:hypothetical protein [Fibrobacter succinogenes]
MKELCVIVDVSGSMYVMGKPLIIGGILQTLSALEKMVNEANSFSVVKMQWDGSEAGFEALIEKCDKKNSLLLTDGYSLSDSCRKSRVIKNFFEDSKDSLYVVLCGGDALDISSHREFSRVNVVHAEDILKVVEILFAKQECSAEEEGW